MLLLKLNCSHALEECLWRNVYGNYAKLLKISVRRGVCDRIEVTGQKGLNLPTSSDDGHLPPGQFRGEKMSVPLLFQYHMSQW